MRAKLCFTLLATALFADVAVAQQQGPTRQILEQPSAPSQPAPGSAAPSGGATPDAAPVDPTSTPAAGAPASSRSGRPPPPVVATIRSGTTNISLPAPFLYCLPERSRPVEAAFADQFAKEDPNSVVFVRCADIETSRQSGQLNVRNFVLVTLNRALDLASTGLQRGDIGRSVCDEARQRNGDFPIAATPEWAQGILAAARGKGADFGPVVGSTSRGCITASVVDQRFIAFGAAMVVRSRGLVIAHFDQARQRPADLNAQFSRVANFVTAIVSVNQGPPSAVVPGAPTATPQAPGAPAPAAPVTASPQRPAAAPAATPAPNAPPTLSPSSAARPAGVAGAPPAAAPRIAVAAGPNTAPSGARPAVAGQLRNGATTTALPLPAAGQGNTYCLLDRARAQENTVVRRFEEVATINAAVFVNCRDRATIAQRGSADRFFAVVANTDFDDASVDYVDQQCREMRSVGGEVAFSANPQWLDTLRQATVGKPQGTQAIIAAGYRTCYMASIAPTGALALTALTSLGLKTLTVTVVEDGTAPAEIESRLARLRTYVEGTQILAAGAGAPVAPVGPPARR